MKNFAKLFALSAGACAFVLACEPAGGSDAETTGGTVYPVEDTYTEPTVDEWPAVEMEDDPNNSTLINCDSGSLLTPGADIDSGTLTKATGGSYYFTGCQLSYADKCQNDMYDAGLAEGAPDGTSTEGFVSLNGGMLRCNWDLNASAVAGDSMQVVEIGGTSGTKTEQYHVRLCKSTGGNCTEYSTYGSGKQTFAVSNLL